MSVSSVGGTYGLSGSGMDIDELVKNLMAGQQAKTDALMQKKTVLDWQKSAYNKVYDNINSFRDSIFNYKLSSTLSPHTVYSNNTSVATATANADAADVNHSLVVAQLATGVNLTSSDRINSDTTVSKTTLATHMGITDSFNLNISDGKTNKIITVDPTDSINDVVSTINKSGLNVKASYDSTLDRFFLSTSTTGSSANIQLSSVGTTDSGQKFIEGLKLGTTNTTTVDGVNTTTFSSASGKDAVFQLDGVQFSQASNTFTIAGVKYNLTGVSTGASMDAGGNPVWGSATTTNVSVSFDVDTAVASIQSLVDSYNKILEELNGMVDETRYKDYTPLTDAQKKVMTDSDITAWEVKAKSGMLHNDDSLTSLIRSMRSAFSNQVSGISASYDKVTGKNVTYNSGSSIGITTGDYAEGGKLHLNTDKLKAALANNPDVLNELFGAVGTTKSDGTIDTSSQGIVGRLYDTLEKTKDKLDEIAGTTANAEYDTESYYAKRITETEKQLLRAEDRFDIMEAAYYTKYNAMEVALQQLNSQSTWLQTFGTNS
ncbi:flagellar filament capping protein FliD [Desulfosporosinus nitroreducens]|uniref:flagellar filament capping protein FliD n=1 Tax=Desulfosporosinus nitroreducens TaxID=2018668 RepID=UPI00207C8609|nr:flagellar filament capping protein FliD [Desulfosporosinus nitroreducens]MCO1601320.1 flagellar filament capping protein FliD [Desulfosporosinus nitroreducens]